MVELPNPPTVIRSPTIVATAVFELVYVNAPVLAVVGGVIAKGALPITFDWTEKPVNVMVPLLTVRVAVVDADK